MGQSFVTRFLQRWGRTQVCPPGRRLPAISGGSYGNESRQQSLGQGDSVWIAPITITSTGDKALFRVFAPITVLRCGFLVTTALTVTPAVLDFDRRITPGSDTGRIDHGASGAALTAPAAAQAAGVVLYRNTQKDLDGGDEVVFAVNTATTAGAGLPFMEFVARHAVPTDNPDYVASST